MTMTPEVFEAASATLAAVKIKPRDVNKVLAHLADKGITAASDAGLLTLTQGDTVLPPASVFRALTTQVPDLFYLDGQNQVAAKADLDGATAMDTVRAKAAYIQKFGTEAWDALPTKRQDGNHISSVVPDPGMTAAQAKRLTLAEKSKFISDFGFQTWQAIQSRR